MLYRPVCPLPRVFSSLYGPTYWACCPAAVSGTWCFTASLPPAPPPSVSLLMLTVRLITGGHWSVSGGVSGHCMSPPLLTGLWQLVEAGEGWYSVFTSHTSSHCTVTTSEEMIVRDSGVPSVTAQCLSCLTQPHSALRPLHNLPHYEFHQLSTW